MGDTDEGPSRGARIGFALIACLGPLLAGISLGFSSPAMETMAGDPGPFKVFDSLQSEGATWFSSIVNIGALIGAFFSAQVCGVIGVANVLRLSCLMFGLPSVGIWWFADAGLLVGLRFPMGLAVGFQSVAAARMIADISPADIRGTMGSVNSAAILGGMWVVQQFGGSVTRVNDMCDWRSLSLSVAIISFGSFLACMALPSKKPEAPKGGAQAVESPKWSEYRAQVIGGFIPMVVRNFTGVNTIAFFGQDILATAHVANADAMGSSVMLMQVIGSIIAIVVIERVGRRVLLLVSCAGMGLSAYGIAVFTGMTNPPGMALTGCMYGYVVFFSFGLGPIPRLLIPEIGLPRVIAMSVASYATSINWAASFAVTGPPLTLMEETIGFRGAYLVFGSISFVGCLLIALLVPETKNMQPAKEMPKEPAANTLIDAEKGGEKDPERRTSSMISVEMSQSSRSSLNSESGAGQHDAARKTSLT